MFGTLLETSRRLRCSAPSWFADLQPVLSRMARLESGSRVADRRERAMRTTA
jgi:hypothetical protein